MGDTINTDGREALINKLRFLVGNGDILCAMEQIPAMPAFSDTVIYFLDALSRRLRQDFRAKEYNDILSYAFWVRKASVQKEKERHINWENRMGRGVAFHIAPSNVPVNFAVSMTSALLAGNACILRVSNKEFQQVDIVCDAINALLKEEYKSLQGYICIVKYEHDGVVTQMLSNLCDVRVIWGGNQTIGLIRQAALPPRAIEMAFADRYSIALIDADYYLGQDAAQVAKDFYTDTYYSDQNACSSPRLVIWFGNKKAEARKRFWHELSALAHRQYELSPVQAVDKLDSFLRLAAACGEGQIIERNLEDNYLYRIEMSVLYPAIMDYKEAGGYFFEYEADSLEEMIPVLGKACQTVALCGVDEETVRTMIKQKGVRGVDRIVPVGKTMELSFRWDGYDMIETMSRIVG